MIGRGKKAEMGVGTLIVFIAMLLVAAVAAGVLISTANSLQERALATGQQAEGQIATHAIVVEVSANNGQNGDVENFASIMKLAAGSDPIKLDDVLFTFNTVQKTATLKYAGTEATTNNDYSGYFTLKEFDVDGDVDNAAWVEIGDWDLDQAMDYIQVAQDNAFQFNFSTDGLVTTTNITDLDLTAVDTIQNATGTLYSAADNSELGQINLAAYIYAASTVYNNQSFNLTPANEGQGYFAVEYIQQGTNFRAGNLQRGDIVKLYYEAPEEINEDEEIRLNFIPKIGTTTLTKFVTPDVIAVERVYLYP